jgi:hypothetical protein
MKIQNEYNKYLIEQKITKGMEITD